MNTKADFIALATKYIKRDGITKMLSILENGDFYTAPASTKYHDSCEGGLVHHSVRVFHCLKLLLDTHCSGKYSDETIAIVALFHDLCKMGFYKVDSRNVKGEDGKWTKVPYYSVEDKLPLGHGEKSVILVQSVMQLFVPELLAIRWHMGGFNSSDHYNSISQAYEECPLALYLHLADMMATYQKVES